MINLRVLPQEVQDIIELKEATEQTFTRFCDYDYTELFFNKVIERADPNVEHSMIISCTGLQGCHLRGTLVQTDKGLKPIESIVMGDLVWSGGAWRPCIPIIRGRQQTLRVTLRNGIVFNMTQDHKMKTSRGWVCAEDMIVGESFIHGNIPWSTEWNDESERAMVVGMLLADGHLDAIKMSQKYDYVRKSSYRLKKIPKQEHEWVKYRIRLYNKDIGVHERFCRALIKYYGATATGNYEDIFNGVKRSTVTCIQNEFVFKALVADGVLVGKKAGIVDVPVWIQMSDAAMNGFLAGYFVCDGSFYGKKNGTNSTIEITSCSERIIRQMQFWLLGRGVVSSVRYAKGMNERCMGKWRLFIRQWESIKEWVDHVPSISDKKVVVARGINTKQWVKYGVETVEKWRKMHSKGMTYRAISDEVGVNFATLWLAINKVGRGIRRMNKKCSKEYLLEVVNIEMGDVGDVFDLHVKDVHEYVVQGLVSSNSGKSLSSISICCMLDPNFSVDNIFFGYDELVQHRHMLDSNSAILVDEQSEVFGLDSHRINIVLQNLKETLRKKSIHFIFCAPTLYPEHQSSMYIIETIYIDFETQEVYAALKTRDGLTLGHIRIPHPLKILDDGSTLATNELMVEYNKKKDAHLEKVLGRRSIDTFEERAKSVMSQDLFKKAEKIYVRKMGYIPQGSLIQIINKVYPEYNAGVVPIEIAGRIKLNKEISGEWEVAGKVTRRDRAGGKRRS